MPTLIELYAGLRARQVRARKVNVSTLLACFVLPQNLSLGHSNDGP